MATTPIFDILLPTPGADDDAWAPILNDAIIDLEAEVSRVDGATAGIALDLSGKVAKIGDVMSGFLTLNADPTAPLHAATRQYVLANSAGLTDAPNDGSLYGRKSLAWAKGVQLNGDTMTGALQTIAGTAAAPSLRMGDDNSGFYGGADVVAISAGGTARFTVATTNITVTPPFRQGAGSAASPSYSFTGDANTGVYRPAVGTLGIVTSGVDRLTVSSTAITSTLPVTLPAANPTGAAEAAHKGYVDAQVATRLTPAAADTAYVNVGGDTMTGALLLPGAPALPAGMSTMGVGAVEHYVQKAGHIAFNEYLNATPLEWRHWEAGFAGDFYLDQTSGVAAITVKPTAAANATAGLGKIWAFQQDGTTNLPGAIINIGGAAGFLMSHEPVANQRLLQFEPGTYIQKAPSSADMHIVAGNSGNLALVSQPSGHWARLQSDGSFVVSLQAYKPGGGVWADTSDARVKDVQSDYTTGLDAICAIRPKVFTFKGETQRDVARVYIGPIAQDIMVPMPETVAVAPGALGDIELEDMHSFDASSVTWATCNAIRELRDLVVALTTRIETLEKPA